MIGSPPIGTEQTSALESSAQSTGSDAQVGSAVLPCKAWKLQVVVRSTVPFHPEGRVSVSASIVSGGVGYQSKGTLMEGETSPPVEFSGSHPFTYSLGASADKWEQARGARVSVRPQVEPFTATVEIKPTKPWVIFKVLDAKDDALVPGLAMGLKLGELAKSGTTTKDGPTIFQQLEHGVRDGSALQIGRATELDLGSVEHADAVWEFVSIESA